MYLTSSTNSVQIQKKLGLSKSKHEFLLVALLSIPCFVKNFVG